MSSATPRPISAGTSAVCSVLQFSPARSPASQVRIASSVCSSRINIAAVTADANPDSATPHNVMRSGVARRARQRPAPSRHRTAAPRRRRRSTGARRESAEGQAQRRGRHHRQRGAGVKPEICGSPSGLRITVCSSSPATPSAAPVSSAAASRTRRRSTIIRCSKLRGSYSSSACSTVCGAIQRAPKPRCTSEAAISSSVSSSSASRGGATPRGKQDGHAHCAAAWRARIGIKKGLPVCGLIDICTSTSNTCLISSGLQTSLSLIVPAMRPCLRNTSRSA